MTTRSVIGHRRLTARSVGHTRLQPKLRIGPTNDRYEREADRVADNVMRMPERNVQRKCAECEGEKKVQRKESGAQAGPSTAPLVVHNALSGNGHPLDPSVRSYMEPRFGHDFANVRVHTDSRAVESANAIGATAYTVGHDVVFGDGAYRPQTEPGRRLIAHELTHVMQQKGSAGLVQRAPKEKTPCSVHVYDASDPKDTAVIPDDKSGIGVTSVADMVTKVKAYVNDEKNACSCVARLEINGHGADGNQSVGAGMGNDADKILDADSTDDHIRQLTGIPFCNTGLFMLMGCHVGRTRGKKLLSRLATLLPGKLVGGAQHYTAGTGLGNKKVTRAGDKPQAPMSERDPFLTSPFVRWHIVIDGKEYVINGDETSSSEGKSKLKKANRIKVVTPDGEVIIK